MSQKKAKTITMKQYLTTLLSGIAGGLLVLAGLTWLQGKEVRTEQQPLQAVTVGHQAAASSPIKSPMDFRKAAKASTSAVVQIYAAETQEQVKRRHQERRRRSSFYDLFGDEFFGYGSSRPKNGSGSGVIISADGYIVTNNHVVGFADNINVTLEDGKKYKATKIGTDPITDLAVIKIEGQGLPSISYGNSDQVEVGEWVLAVGNPFSYLTSTVTAGIVSAKGRDLDVIEDGQGLVEFIQTDAAVNPGNSGGALVNTEGELIGINTAIATPTGVYAGYSFAIPSNLVGSIVASIIENGDIRGNKLGVEGYDVDRGLVEEYSLGSDFGFLVITLDPSGNAAKAGLKDGDVITGIEDKKVYHFDDLQDAMAITSKGQNIKIHVDRNGKRLTKRVVLQ